MRKLRWTFIQSQDGEFLKQELHTCTNVTLSFQKKSRSFYLLQQHLHLFLGQNENDVRTGYLITKKSKQTEESGAVH